MAFSNSPRTIPEAARPVAAMQFSRFKILFNAMLGKLRTPKGVLSYFGYLTRDNQNISEEQ